MLNLLQVREYSDVPAAKCQVGVHAQSGARLQRGQVDRGAQESERLDLSASYASIDTHLIQEDFPPKL